MEKKVTLEAMLADIVSSNLSKVESMEGEERKKVVDETTILLDKISDLRNADLEKEKVGVTWKRATFEMAKIVVPTLLSGAIYFIAQRRVLEFEETGRITTTAGRLLGLPKLPR